MNKTLLSIGIAALFVACGPAKKPTTDESTDSSEHTHHSTEESEPEAIEHTEAHETSNEGFIGAWTVDAATAGVRMDVKFEDGGAYWQSIAGQETSGTWKKIDDTHLEMKNPNLKEPQTWEIKEMTETTLSICWNPNSRDPKTIPFQRAEE